MDTINVLEDTVYAKKCNFCNKFLSVPPIVAVSEDGNQYKCGRCKDIKCKTYMRCFLFEDVAKCLLYPCDYKDCEEKIPWKLIEAHEKQCSHRTIQCPVYYGRCQSSGPVKVTEFECHFKQNHGGNTKYENANFDLDIHSSAVLLLVANNEKYFIHLSTATFSVTIFSVVPAKESLKCCVTLSTIDNNISMSYKNIEIMCYDENQHCFKCMNKVCHNKQHPFSQEYPQLTNKNWFTVAFDKDLVMNFLDHPKTIRFSVSITDADNEIEKKNAPKEAQVVDVAPKIFALHEKLLRCPICQIYMVAPIYSCETGHTICTTCKQKLEKCPTCKATMGGTRNYTLEELGEKAEVPCIYAGEGCNFIGKPQQVIQHEIDCACSGNVSKTV